MKTLTINKESLSEILLKVIESGVTFEATEKGNFIIFTFTGGY
jgi:hypothetical protein